MLFQVLTHLVFWCLGMFFGYLIATKVLTKLIRRFPYDWRGRKLDEDMIDLLDRVLCR